MSDVTAEERFRRWHLPWKERVCEEVRAFSHGTVFRSPRHANFWEYNCIRLDRPMEASEMIAAAERELVGCAHRLAEWMTPMPDGVVGELRERGWMATPLIFRLHDGRALPEGRGELVEVARCSCALSAGVPALAVRSLRAPSGRARMLRRR